MEGEESNQNCSLEDVLGGSEMRNMSVTSQWSKSKIFLMRVLNQGSGI
jgi:hypothetical protein